METGDGWVALSGVGKQLANAQPDFDPRNYGAKKLIDLVEKSGQFEIKRDAQSIRIRAKPAEPEQPSKPRKSKKS